MVRKDPEATKAYNAAYYQANKDKRKTKTSAKAVKKWQSQHVKRYGFPVMIDTESEIIEKLESVPNKSGYIKDLIKKDIAENKDK